MNEWPVSNPNMTHTRGAAIALVSAKGSPGVTTSAILLAAVWPSGAALLEADPAGGVVRALFTDPTGQSLRPDRGVVSLLTADQTAAATELLAHSQQIPGGLPVVLGPSNASQVEALRPPWPRLANVISDQATAGGTVIVDAGRLGDPSSLALTVPLLRSCTTTLVVTRASVTALAHARDLLSLLRDVAIPTGLLLIADARNRTDVAQALDLALDEVHLLPHDPAAAAALTGPWTRRLDRSQLLTAARAVAAALANAMLTNAMSPLRAASSPDAVVDLTDAGVAGVMSS
jgi:MinD-like ATPase involved in chromosome partitioning or flagellar assembly